MIRTKPVGLSAALFLSAVLLAFTAPAGASNEREPPAIDQDDHAHAVDPHRRGAWMLKQSDPRTRAMGLYLMLGPPLFPESDPITAVDDDVLDRWAAGVLDELSRSIRTTTDPAALQWLAAACAAGEVEEFCRKAGLDAAIVRHDQGNLVSRVGLADDDAVAELLLESDPGRHYWAEAVETAYRAARIDPAMRDLPTRDVFGLTVFPAPVPAVSGISGVCTRPAPAEPALHAACTRLARTWSHGQRSTLLLRNVGRAISRELAEQSGLEDEARRINAEQLFESAQLSCFAEAAEDYLMTMDHAEIEEWIGLLKTHGEFGTYRELGERLGADCSNPPDPMAEHLDVIEAILLEATALDQSVEAGDG
jgi:hypothetical protein